MNNLELYIHIPFCERKCKYCDFVSFRADYQNIANYINILIKEIENKKYLANDYIISSIYIGGGTPSFIDSKFIKFILESIKTHYNLSSNVEISMEANPNSATEEKLKEYFDIGINRLSFGLQSCNDNELKMLGRVHTYRDFLNSYDNAVHIGFKNINVDIINGIPEQSVDSYKKTLKQILMLQTKHISIYNLIIEPGTEFYELNKKGLLNLPDEDTIIGIDEVTKELTDYYRLNRYEISNYAKSGYECKHNLGYWSNIPYLGFGLNAASYYNHNRYKNKRNFNDYLKLNYDNYLLDNEKLNYYDDAQMLDKTDLMSEYVMLGFRKIRGIDKRDFFSEFNENFDIIFKKQLDKYMNIGLILQDNYYYKLSDNGMQISNTILSDFLLK